MADVDRQGVAGGATQRVPATPSASLPSGSTSLVTTDQTVHEPVQVPDPWSGGVLCPRIDHDRQYWLNTFTGEKRHDSCRANVCPVCVNVNAWKKARLLTWAKPERYIVLTQAPTDWDKLRQKMRNLRRLEQAQGYDYEHAWTVEINPRGTGLHVNVLQKGSYIPQKALQQTWGSIVYIQAIKRPQGQLEAYVLKDALTVSGYVLKDAGSVPAHLAANGNRLAHVSRGYFPTNPATGKPFTQAEAWAEMRPTPEPGWRLVTG